MDAADFSPQKGQIYIVAASHGEAADKAHEMLVKATNGEFAHAALKSHDDGHTLAWFHLTTDQTDLAGSAKAAGADVFFV